MSRVLIIEDNASDIRLSAGVLKKLNVTDVDGVNNVASALLRLQDAVDGKGTAPDLIVLDLSFTRESGFEVLRFWKSNRDRLNTTVIVVWTSMGETEQQLCRYFGVDVVQKWTGPDELEKVLRKHLPASRGAAQSE